MRKISNFTIFMVVCLIVMLSAGAAFADAWQFGIISDTQWTTADPANQNPNTIPASIIKQVNQQFINKGVKFVIAMGDMVDTGSQTNDYSRALYSQDLYNAGIGFYPMRGNHEAANGSYTGSGADFWHAYPQIINGMNNDTPPDITTALIPPAVMAVNPPAAMTGSAFTIGTGFSYPTVANNANGSVSYAFQYNNATFMILDQFQSPDYYTSHIIPEQQDWISNTLSTRPANTHAFAFTHKNVLGGNHKDNMFGGQVVSSDPGDGYGVNLGGLTAAQQVALASKQAAESTFLGLLQNNNVKYMISGHDHHHYNSVVTSFDQASKVHQLICQSDSSKFYTPGNPVSANDMPVEQDLQRVGYYLFTVDGPRVTIEYFADTHGGWLSDGNYPLGATDLVNYPKNVTPNFTFAKRSTFGYSLNGKENLVAHGAAYTMNDNTTVAATMEPGFLGTSMSILSGTNGSTATTNYGKATSKAVNTGWSPQTSDTISDVLYLWGMNDLGATSTDKYVLSMSFDPSVVVNTNLINQGYIVAIDTKDANGNWVNLVNQNVGGGKRFVLGAWNKVYPLGTYGVDPKTNTAWAVINTTGSGQLAVVMNHN